MNEKPGREFHPVGTEALCTLCGEVFNPTGEEDDPDHPEHYCTEDGEECGGVGRIVGQWGWTE